MEGSCNCNFQSLRSFSVGCVYIFGSLEFLDSVLAVGMELTPDILDFCLPAFHNYKNS